jgi:hypothetical protein
MLCLPLAKQRSGETTCFARNLLAIAQALRNTMKFS